VPYLKLVKLPGLPGSAILPLWEDRMTYVVIVIALALLQFMSFGAVVGWARDKYQVPAPATTGNEVFERYFRVQMNTLEQLVVFLPAIWLFAQQVSATWAAGLGVVYLIGRLVYFRSYTRDPKSRGLAPADGLPASVMRWVLIDAILQPRLTSITTIGSRTPR
jgi:uncharacterized MAPEG superfamily protein